GLMDHVTPPVAPPCTLAVNCWAWDDINVVWLGLTLTEVTGPGGVSVMDAVAVLGGSARLATVSKIVFSALIVYGALFTPFASVPTAGDSGHVAPVVVVPLIDTLNWLVWLAETVAAVGLTAIPTVGTRVIVAVADFVVSAVLVAVTVTVCWLVMVAGAV